MEQKVFVSIMVPAFCVQHESQIDMLIKQTLRIEKYEVFEIPSQHGKEFGVKVQDNPLNLQEIERLMMENKNLQTSYDKCKESLQTLNAEFDKIINDPDALSEQDKLKFQKQQKRVKEVRDENKRLREMLKQQVDMYQKKHFEYSSTIEQLQEQLDQVANELKQFQDQKKHSDIFTHN